MNSGSSHPKSKVKALVLRTAGTNCDQETIHALTMAGASCELAHVNKLLTAHVRLFPYQILVIPGGFSYGDDISAGKVLANELKVKLKDQLVPFVKAKKLVIGICNGFQVLVKTGLLPGWDVMDETQTVTLALNDSARFQCEWTKLKVEKSAATWLNELPDDIELPIAHGEGKFITGSPKIAALLQKNKQIVFRYIPHNPNGSQDGVAGICNPQGNVVGLMPHPERYLTKYEHPDWPTRSLKSNPLWGDGSLFWQQAIAYAKEHLN